MEIVKGSDDCVLKSLNMAYTACLYCLDFSD